ncbi:MAG: NAD(P)/FAD-dependent oxidoreductase [Ferrovum sp.]|nr:NAD(P)/FAD-dependent oxidoreductase [Ferrovum sp.]
MPSSPPPSPWHLIIIGAGFAGLALGLRLRQQGEENFLLLEQAPSAGGTWRDNRYPGCACDVPSHLYSLSSGPAWDWSRRYADHREIEAYLQQVARELDPHIRYQTQVVSAHWEAREGTWKVHLNTGETLASRFLAAAPGPLTTPSLPIIPGIDTFTGPVVHSARWPDALDVAGKRVALIGTGASAIQIAPAIAPRVQHLTVFQRTAPWIVAREDRPYTAHERQRWREQTGWRQWYRSWLYLRQEIKAAAFLHPSLMQRLEKSALSKLHQAVQDPVLRQLLTPADPMGCKRILLSDDYWHTLQRPHVTLETDPITRIEGQNIITREGRTHQVDVLVCATGFRYQDNPMAALFTGENGQSLEAFWAPQRGAYLGLMMPPFPNFFLLTGPFSGLGHNSIVFMIESQVNWIIDTLGWLRRHGKMTLRLKDSAYASFMTEMNIRSKRTLWMQGCHSWYLDGQGRNTALWPGYSLGFWWRTRRFSPKDFIHG